MNDQDHDQPSILIGFKARNVRSFREELSISALATSVGEPEFVREVPWRLDGRMVRANMVLAFYGANGSGKSNAMKAIADMRNLVVNSFHAGRNTTIERHPFLLDSESRKRPSTYEIDLVVQGVRWEYGFTVDDDRVLEEWAYRYPHGRQALVFDRDGDDLTFGSVNRAKSKAVREVLRPNALLLSTAAHANHPDLIGLYEWFERNLPLAEAQSRMHRQLFTARLLEDDDLRGAVLDLLRAADLGITNAHVGEPDPLLQEQMKQVVQIFLGEDSDIDPPDFSEMNVRLVHRCDEGHEVDLPPEDESLGTRVWFGLVGPVIRALADGSVLLADELDSSLHPVLVSHLVRLFQDESTNPYRAQLIFNTHDAGLLGDGTNRILGRDQVWFCEKDRFGSSHVYSLASLSPRKNEALSDRYLAGRYGGTPIVSHEEFTAAAELVTGGAR